MDKLWFLLLVLTLTTTNVSSHSVFGTIQENITWFHTNLSVVPAMTATLEYHIQYPDVPDRARPIITFYYNGQDSPNLSSHCETDLFGQLRNEDLAVPLSKVYRTKFICYKGNQTWYCYGKTTIQDFEPKTYSFSFCNECGSTTGNLSGLIYNVSIYDESNKTSCVDLSLKAGHVIDRCERYYKYGAIPNQIGDTKLETAMFKLTKALTILDRLIDLLTHKKCLQEMYQVLCLAFIPECLPDQNQVIVPCMEYCNGFLNDCLKHEIFTILVDEFELNCDYLPSKNSSTTCYSKDDLCGPPPEVTHGYVLEGSVPLAKAGEAVHYGCNDSMSQEGSPNSTCLATGQWSTPPECASNHRSLIMIICIAAGGFILLVLITIVIGIVVKKRRNQTQGPLESENFGSDSIMNRNTEPLVNEIEYE